MRRFIMILAVFTMMAQSVAAIENPIAVGAVHWGRNLGHALKVSGETGRPVFVLFQEVPGCGGCQDFGRTVLSNPLVVEAVEDEFLPVLVYNNRGGKDQQLLDRFDEPAWNFQIVRFLDAKGRDIIPRKDHVWTTGELAVRMIEVLKAAQRPVAKYLQALAEEDDFGISGRKRLSAGEQAIYQVPGLTDIQRTKIEALISVNRFKALEWLSPRQRQSLKKAEQNAAVDMNKPHP